MENEQHQENDILKPRGSILDITPEALAEFDEYCQQHAEDERRKTKGHVAGRVRRERRVLRRRFGLF